MDIAMAAPEPEHASTTGHRSARSQRIEVITRGERRRAWDLEQKREIVIESLQPDARPSDVARRHGINTGLLYTWRRQMLEGQLGEAPRLAPRFARVDTTAAALELSDGGPGSPGCRTQAAEPLSIPVPPTIGGIIEITLPSGISLRVDALVDSRALRRVLTALEGR
ncbi:MAG: IS66-like element accessory protein TnpA [Steroidobacteraceae bacterium]